MSKLKELVEWMDKSWDKERKGLALAEWHNALLDKARSLLAEEQSDCKHAKELEESMTAAIKEKMAEQSHTPEQGGDGLTEQEGMLQAITNMGIILIGGNAYVQQDRVLDIISRHTAKVDKDEEVVPLAVLGRKYDLYITFVWNDVQWFCHISDGRGDIKKILNGATYSAAELKARQYLEGLPDRKGE